MFFKDFHVFLEKHGNQARELAATVHGFSIRFLNKKQRKSKEKDVHVMSNVNFRIIC